VTLRSALALELVRCHPIRAALELERAGARTASALLAHADADDLADVLPNFSPQFASDVCEMLPDDLLSAAFSQLPFEEATRLLRAQGGTEAPLIEKLPSEIARPLLASVRFPEDSAGGLMDPNVLALPAMLNAEEATQRLREHGRHARYNLYVVDPDGGLAGVLNLRELLLADAEQKLGDLMVRQPENIKAFATRANIISHPGWRVAHSLPVVDEKGRYLGAIRYRTLRKLEAAESRQSEPSPAGDLGELFSLGAGAALRALTTGDESEGA